MLEKAKPKYVLLQEFTNLLYERDPMQLKTGQPDEYEVEALSILSRFTEANLHTFMEQGPMFEAALSVASQTFWYWFDLNKTKPDFGFQELTSDLVRLYLSSYIPDGVCEEQ